MDGAGLSSGRAMDVMELDQQSWVIARDNLAATQNGLLRSFDIYLDKVHPFVSARAKIIERHGFDRYTRFAQGRYCGYASRKSLVSVPINCKL